LVKRGVPSYSESLERFLYCGSCATLSETSPFYCLEKAAGMPDFVHDAADLVSQWKQLLAVVPEKNDLPCGGCPDTDACYGPEALVSQRIVPFSFFPFYMLMFPAPSCRAAEFLSLVAGDTASAPWPAHIGAPPSGTNRFLFQDPDRQFFEILYLKLTFLEQVYRQLMPADDPAAVQEFDLSLEGIGIDLNPPGAGLPAYWNFNVRILNAVGAFQVSPFAPIMPEAPRLHFLGAVWFRTLLVNSRQKADAVYAEVGRLLGQLDIEKGAETLEIETSDPVGVFASNQIFWSPDQRSLAENWQVFWKKGLRLGLHLVHAGLKTGVAWRGSQFLAALEELRADVKSSMFAEPVVAAVGKDKSTQSDKIAGVLRGILKKWRAQAASAGSQPMSDVSPLDSDMEETVLFSSALPQPPQATEKMLPTAVDLEAADVPDLPSRQPKANDWEEGVEETVIISSAQTAPPYAASQHDAPGPSVQEPQWNEDMEETVILKTGGAPDPNRGVPPPDDDLTAAMNQKADKHETDDEIMEQTIIIRSDVKKE
ncbi:hypothetical protein, partial [Desulfosarcina sp.]|uniref:hypothetical protein n=1 Tax=Desulfosarcina sp. TaxID=2027861 RepID=UPI0039708A25